MVSREVDFKRLLLFHPQRDMAYIRKLTMSYGYYVALAAVDGNDRVTHIGVSNSFQIVSFNELDDNDRSILGSERCNRLSGDDLMSVYKIKRAVKLIEPYKLYRHCRSMRYTSPEETYELKKILLATLNNTQTVIRVEDKPDNYNGFYQDHVELDLENIDLDLSEGLENLELPNFQDNNANGQTRLI